MLTLRQRKNVVDNKIVVEIPTHFGSEVEVIILSNHDELKPYGNDTTDKTEETDWNRFAVTEFLYGYGMNDSIYDNYELVFNLGGTK